MNDLNEQIQSTVTLTRGTVITAPSDATFSVQVGAAARMATRATSCLLLPLVGDAVLVVDATIIAVLQRHEAAPSTLCAEHLRIEGESLHVQTAQTTISSTLLTLTGRTITAAAGTIRLLGQTISQVAEQIRSTAQCHVRYSERMDEVHAAAATVRVDGVHETRGEAVVMRGRRVVRIDGGQVQVG